MDQKIKNMAVALDFSEYSQSILDYAVHLARRTGAGISVIHIINRKAIDSVKRQFEMDRLESFPYADYVAREKKSCASKMEALIKNSKADDIHFQAIINEGVPSVEILKLIKQGETDFLVIGQKGRSDLPDFLTGGVCEKVFRHSPVPVLRLRFPKQRAS
jgi:nucleotide-binding universal stress UspA family protein